MPANAPPTQSAWCPAHVAGGRRATLAGSLPLARVTEVGASDTWRNLRNELERLHLVTMATSEGTVSQRSKLTAAQRALLLAFKVSEPPRFYDFTPAPEIGAAS